MNKILAFILLFIVWALPEEVLYSSPQEKIHPPVQQSTISVTGRLYLEKHGQEEWLVLHSRDAQAYLIKGELIEELKDSLLELGEDNLVSVRGNQDGRSNISCERFYRYKYNKSGKKELKKEIRCIRYHNLDITEILFAKKSDEEIPPPEEDTEQKKRLLTNERNVRALQPAIIGEIYGKIESVNVKSPIKTIEIANRDQSSPLRKIILIISPDTRIVKNIDEEEPITLTPAALKTGQEVIVMYSRDELKSEALLITITKE